jgi:ppGpp synthetase/RelA/SpoT-type nucleotidyltranferase
MAVAVSEAIEHGNMGYEEKLKRLRAEWENERMRYQQVIDALEAELETLREENARLRNKPSAHLAARLKNILGRKTEQS